MLFMTIDYLHEGYKPELDCIRILKSADLGPLIKINPFRFNRGIKVNFKVHMRINLKPFVNPKRIDD